MHFWILLGILINPWYISDGFKINWIVCINDLTKTLSCDCYDLSRVHARQKYHLFSEYPFVVHLDEGHDRRRALIEHMAEILFEGD